MTSTFKMRQQLRGYLELERLFGVSSIFCDNLKKPHFKKKNAAFSTFDLLVLLPRGEEGPEEQGLLQRMLAPLEIEEKNIVISSCQTEEISAVIKKFPARAVLTTGQLSEYFELSKKEGVFSSYHNKIPIFTCFSPGHLLKNPEDKKQSWNALLALKNFLKS